MTIVFGDLHGNLEGFLEVLYQIPIKKNTKLIFLGDYVDGLPESAELVEELIKLKEAMEIPPTFLMGNHDWWFYKFMTGKKLPTDWYRKWGGQSTVQSYKKTGYLIDPRHLKFFADLLPYYITGDDLFLHAGFTTSPEREKVRTNLFFDRTLWNELRLKGDTIDRTKGYRRVFIGHTASINEDGSTMPRTIGNVTNVDTGSGFVGGKLTALNINTGELYQSSPCDSLYPDGPIRQKWKKEL